MRILRKQARIPQGWNLYLSYFEGHNLKKLDREHRRIFHLADNVLS
jgi:hypothetical protein